MHQERVVYLPNCPKNMPCPLSTMKDLYPSSKEECQFDVMCNLNENDVSYTDDDDEICRRHSNGLVYNN